MSANDKNKTEIGFEVVKAKLGFSKNPGATAIALSAYIVCEQAHLWEFVQLVQTQKTLNSFSSRSASFRRAGVREKALSSPPLPSPPGAQLSGHCNLLRLSSSSSATFWHLLATLCILSNFPSYLPILRFRSGFYFLNWPFYHISQCYSRQFMNFL